MATETARFSARRIRDVTNITAEELLSPVVPLKIAGEGLQRESPEPAKCHVICVASGKGGTGKSVITTNFATVLAREGLKVLLFDADLGLANAHILLGVNPLHDISSVKSGEKRLRDIMIECPSGLKLICGGSGFSELAELGDNDLRNIAFGLKGLEPEFDVIFADLSAGISPQVVRFLGAAHDVILVTNPDAMALLDAYATIKVMANMCGGVRAKIVVNKARSREDAVAAFKKIEDVSARRLPNAELSFFGWLPQNFYVQDSVARRDPVVLSHPRSFATECIKNMARRIGLEHADWKRKESVSFSWKLGQMVYER